MITLFKAIETGDAHTVRELLAATPTLANVRGTVPYWTGECTPLQLAAEHGSQEIVELLVNAGADVNDKASLTGWAPLHFALSNADLAQYLISRGAHVDIHAAAGLGDLAAMRSIVELDPNAVHSRGPDGATPLHFAATAEMATLLIDRGAELEVLDHDHKGTPLAWQASNREVASLLLARGASVDSPFLAAALGDLGSLRRFIDTDPSCIHAVTPEGDLHGAGATLLHIAARNGHAEIVSILLDRGALVNARGGWCNVTPLHSAAQGGWIETARIMLDHGADLSIRDSEHDGTPLDWARFFEQAEMIVLLSR